LNCGEQKQIGKASSLDGGEYYGRGGRVKSRETKRVCRRWGWAWAPCKIHRKTPQKGKVKTGRRLFENPAKTQEKNGRGGWSGKAMRGGKIVDCSLGDLG